MNAVMQRWIQTCRRELLDRTLTWNQPHLLDALDYPPTSPRGSPTSAPG
jgi:hypothetical protein